MREILFRGQTRRFGEKIKNIAGDQMPSHWVYGRVRVLQGTGDFPIIYGGDNVENADEEFGKHTVYTDSIGQYTGLKDENGVKIFEGDIVAFTRWNALGWMNERVGTVLFHEEFWSYCVMATTGDAWFWGDIDNMRVIGNIYDNPELLEVEKC